MKTIEQMYNEAKALVEDRTYQIGEISEKTGLQKTANGWRPPKKENKSKEQNSEKKASKMTYKEAESHLNEKQKELLNNMAKQNGKSIEEIYNEFKDVINFGKRDPKLMEELERSNRFKQEKMAKERQKKEDEIKQQRQEGEANARAFQEKVERGEIVYNEKTGQFEEVPKENKKTEKEEKSKWKKTTDYLGRDRISLKTKQGGLVSIYETDNPNQKNNRFRVDTGTHTNTFNTMEEAKAFAEKHYGNESKKETAEIKYTGEWKTDAEKFDLEVQEGVKELAAKFGKSEEEIYQAMKGLVPGMPKENGPKGDVDRFVKNNKSMWQKNIEKAPDARLKELAAKSEKGNAAEKEVAKMAKEELVKRNKENGPKENGVEKKTSSKSLKLPDEKSSFQTDVNRMKKLKKEDYKQYTIQLEKLHSKYPINKWKDLYNKTANDSACRITADTKIKLSKIKK